METAGPMAVKNKTIFAFVNIKHVGLLKILHIFFPLKSLQSQDNNPRCCHLFCRMPQHFYCENLRTKSLSRPCDTKPKEQKQGWTKKKTIPNKKISGSCSASLSSALSLWLNFQHQRKVENSSKQERKTKNIRSWYVDTKTQKPNKNWLTNHNTCRIYCEGGGENPNHGIQQS